MTTLLLLYLLALLSLAIGASAVYMAMIEVFPIRWLYWLQFTRKPMADCILAVGIGLVASDAGSLPIISTTVVPLLFMVLGAVLSRNMTQEAVFRAIDYPPIAEDPFTLPLPDDAEMAVIEYNGVTRAYSLDQLIHHHIVNDSFGDKIVSLTYCAMCRTIVPFDVTDIGPLFVASFKNANMIVGDRRTRTYFQQETFESVIGALHPYTLQMISYQILPWREVKRLDPMPFVASVTEHDLRAFELPIPGVWKRIIASEATPGLSSRRIDKTLPARTRVVGVLEQVSNSSVFVKEELMKHGVVKVPDSDIVLVAVNGTVNGFRSNDDTHLKLTPDHRLEDGSTTWDLRGKYLRGKRRGDLTPAAISDEYWFSWKFFHPQSKLVRLEK